MGSHVIGKAVVCLAGVSAGARRQSVYSSGFLLGFRFGPGEDGHRAEVGSIKIRK